VATVRKQSRPSGIHGGYQQVIQGIPYDLFPFYLLIFHLLRFQVVVLSAYKQIRAQSDDILSDINEDNYDRAFSFLRPGKLNTCLFAPGPLISLSVKFQ